jgi:hypothetical protein
MSDYATESGPDIGPDVSEQQMSRYVIHVPVNDNDMNEIPHVLDATRRALGDAGFQGRTVVRKAQGDWQGDEQNYSTEEMDLVMVDGPDDSTTQEAILGVAMLVKSMAGQEAVYVTKQPITTFLV